MARRRLCRIQSSRPSRRRPPRLLHHPLTPRQPTPQQGMQGPQRRAPALVIAQLHLQARMREQKQYHSLSRRAFRRQHSRSKETWCLRVAAKTINGILSQMGGKTCAASPTSGLQTALRPRRRCAVAMRLLCVLCASADTLPMAHVAHLKQGDSADHLTSQIATALAVSDGFRGSGSACNSAPCAGLDQHGLELGTVHGPRHGGHR